MGILDAVLNVLKGQVAGNAAAPGAPAAGGNADLLNAVVSMISDPNSGGLTGLVDKLTQGGLANQVASWVSTGTNLPVTADQIHSALGSPVVQEIAAKLGIDVNNVTGSLAHMLPQIVDKLTPEGQVPGDNSLLEIGLKGLTAILGNKSA